VRDGSWVYFSFIGGGALSSLLDLNRIMKCNHEAHEPIIVLKEGKKERKHRSFTIMGCSGKKTRLTKEHWKKIYMHFLDIVKSQFSSIKILLFLSITERWNEKRAAKVKEMKEREKEKESFAFCRIRSALKKHFRDNLSIKKKKDRKNLFFFFFSVLRCFTNVVCVENVDAA
jgi:hypothetical protein